MKHIVFIPLLFPLVALCQPTANAGRDTTVKFPTGTYKLVGKGSGDGIKYRWNVLRTTLPAASESELIFDLYNTKVTYRLTVTDRFGQSASDDVVITFVYDSTFGGFNYEPSKADTIRYQTLLYVQKGSSYTTPKKKENSYIVRKEEAGKVVWYEPDGKLIDPFIYKSLQGYWLIL